MENKILVVSTVPSPPIVAGNSKCIYEYCDLLKRNGFSVHFLYITGKSKLSTDMFNKLKDYWGDNLHVFNRILAIDGALRLAKKLKSLIRGYDGVDDLYPYGLTHYIKRLNQHEKFRGIIINYISLSKLFEKRSNYRRIVFTHDVFSFKKERLGLDKFWCSLTPDEEAKGLQRADTILSIQENESVYFSYLSPQNQILTVFSYFPIHQQTLTGNMNILFFAGNNKVNYNGISHFIKMVLPIVLVQIPSATLLIGGSICNALIKERITNIQLLGRFENEEEFYSKGDVVVNPVFQGTGLKIKTFESLSYGKATIVHPHSVEGIYKPDDAPLLIGKTDEEMADLIIKVLLNNNIRSLYCKRSIDYMLEFNKYVESQFLRALK